MKQNQESRNWQFNFKTSEIWRGIGGGGERPEHGIVIEQEYH